MARYGGAGRQAVPVYGEARRNPTRGPSRGKRCRLLFWRAALDAVHPVSSAVEARGWCIFKDLSCSINYARFSEEMLNRDDDLLPSAEAA